MKKQKKETWDDYTEVGLPNVLYESEPLKKWQARKSEGYRVFRYFLDSSILQVSFFQEEGFEDLKQFIKRKAKQTCEKAHCVQYDMLHLKIWQQEYRHKKKQKKDFYCWVEIRGYARPLPSLEIPWHAIAVEWELQGKNRFLGAFGVLDEVKTLGDFIKIPSNALLKIPCFTRRHLSSLQKHLAQYGVEYKIAS